MKQSKDRRHSNSIEYNCCCTVQNIYTVVAYHYVLRLKSLWIIFSLQ